MVLQRNKNIHLLPVSIASIKWQESWLYETSFVKIKRHWNSRNATLLKFLLDIGPCRSMRNSFEMSWNHLLHWRIQAKFWGSEWCMTDYYLKNWLLSGERCMWECCGLTTPGWWTFQWSGSWIYHLEKCSIPATAHVFSDLISYFIKRWRHLCIFESRSITPISLSCNKWNSPWAI